MPDDTLRWKWGDDLPRCRVCRRPMSTVRVSDTCGPCQGGVLPPPVPVDLRIRRKPSEEEGA